jgi:hypothetical protein
MSINFPSSPSSGDSHTAGGVVYAYDGTSWSGSSTITPLDALSSGIAESVQAISSVTGAQTIDLDNGHIIICSSVTGDLTLNLTNTGLGTNQATAVVVQVLQGATPYVVDLGTIDGASSTTQWQGGATPTGNGSKTDIYFFNITKTASVEVYGHMLCYG